MGIKISAIQKRLNAGKTKAVKSNGFTARGIPDHISPDGQRQELPGSKTSYFAYMSAKNAMRVDHKNAYVISIRNPGAEPYVFNCKGQHNLFFEAGSRNIADEVMAGLGEFVQKVFAEECPVIHVHCSYGEIRSYTLADVLQETALRKDIDSRVWQVTESGRWVTGSNTTGSFDGAVHHAATKAIARAFVKN